MSRVGIIAALPGELKPLVQGWKPVPLPGARKGPVGTPRGMKEIPSSRLATNFAGNSLALRSALGAALPFSPKETK